MEMFLLLSSLSVGRMRKLKYTKSTTPPFIVKNNFINQPIHMKCQFDGDSNIDRMLSLLGFYLWLYATTYLHQLSVNIQV